MGVTRAWMRDVETAATPDQHAADREFFRREIETARLLVFNQRAVNAGITDETPVEFDGEMTTWGALMLADRKTVERDADGVLRGGYPY
jgi:hypothetical protein